MKRPNNKIKLFIIFFFFFNLSLFAQDFSLNLSCQTYPSPFIADWENNPGIVNISINYTGTSVETVRLESRAVSVERGEIARGQSDNIIFTAPQTIYRDNRDFLNYRNITYNSEYREQIVRTGRLLEGSYTLYVQLVRVRSGAVLDEKQATFYILSFNPPSLVAPTNLDTVRIQFPTFQWTPATSHPGFVVRYHLKICEIRAGQTPQVAINNIPHHSEVIVDQVSFTYPNSAPALEENKNYCWQVQAKDRNDVPIGDNEGKSEVWQFTYKTTTEPEFSLDSVRLFLARQIPVNATVQAKVKFWGRGSGDVRGRFLIDNNPWRVFSQHTYTLPDSFFSTSLPTGEGNIGSHKLKIEITEPNELKDSINYEVVRDTGLRLDSLLLVDGVALIKEISNPLTPDGPPGSNRYRFPDGTTATIKLLSLDNNSVASCTLSNFKIILNPSDRFRSQIDTGLVQRTAGEDTSFFGYKNDFLKISKVRFEKRGGPVDFISVNAKLNIPRINITLYEINDLIVKRNGIEGKGFSTTQEFSRWGVTFSLHDISGNRAITVGKTGDTLWASFSGDIKLSRQGTQTILTQFTNFKVTHRGKITGRFAFADPFRFIPNNPYLKLDTINFYDSLDQYYLRFTGKIESLPKPIDTILPRTRFSFLIDMDGRTVGKIVPLNELSPDRRGTNNDLSEFRIPVVDCTLDLTYLGITLTIVNNDLKLNQSKIELAMDIYFPFKDERDQLLPVEERRLAIGELNRLGELEGAITIDFNGNLNWNLPPSIPVIRNKRLNLGDVIRFKLEEMAIEPLPFGFVFNCSLGINVYGVGGGARIEGLKIRTNGDIEYPIVRGGGFKILEVFNVSIGLIRWSSKDTTLSFNSDQTTGEGEGRNFQSGTQSISCRGYFLMEDAEINIGSGGSVASGRFNRLLVYKPTSGGSKKVTLTGANLSIAGMQLLADYDYSNPTGNLRFAGTLNIPSGIGVTCVGKIGNRNGHPSFGLFVAARGLNIPVGPGITLTGLGGGFFWYPEEIDISTVRAHCGFTRSEMTNKFQEKKPRADDPGAFALLLYGAVEFLGSDALVTGQALLTLTTRRFDLDAEARVLKIAEPGIDAKGMLYLSVGWNPAYAEGRVQVDVNVVELISGDGYFEFYVYSSDAWGIMGGAELSVIRIVDAETDFFIGNPGFLLEVSFDFGIDIYVLSGSIDFDGMVWYKKIDPRSWGGYAGLWASADILGGLVGASFGLEGALIGEPEYLVYCVGTLRVEALWVEVFSGSIWVSIGRNGFDGGTGRNSRYDQLIEDARNMADQMEEEKERVKEAMAEAKEKMFALSEEQRQRAGMALVEASGWKYDLYRTWYDTEMERWWWYYRYVYGLIPPVIFAQRDSGIFDPVSAQLKMMRDTLRERERLTGYFLQTQIESTQARVNRRIDSYRAIIEERLPTVREVGLLGSPLRGKSSQTITVQGRDTSFTVTAQVGYDIDYVQADRQKSAIDNAKSDNEQYRQELLRIAGLIDEKLLKLDSLLYISTRYRRDDMSGLCSLYYEGYNKVIDYYWLFGDYLDKNQHNAAKKIAFFNRKNSWGFPCSTIILNALREAVNRIDSSRHRQDLRVWVNTRRELIYNVLLQEPVQNWPPIPSDFEGLRNMWVSFGMEIWYNIPKAGYQEIIRLAPERRDTVLAVYRRGVSNFSRSWENWTLSLDRVYTRKSEFYELLYDLYDQIELLGDVPTPVPRRTVTIRGRTYPMIARRLNFSPASRRKSDLAQLLRPPRITSFNGEYISDATTPTGFGRLNLSWSATHPVKVVDYSFWLRKEGERFGLLPSPKTLGLAQTLWLPFIKTLSDTGNYGIFLRARGAGGYPIIRKGVVRVNYYDADVGSQRNRMSSVDTTPPTRPVITTDTVIASSGQIYAQWSAFDGESGIEEYQYRLGSYFYSPTLRRYVYNPVLDWTSSGGRTEVNIRNLNLHHGETYKLSVKAKNGVGLWSQEGERTIRIDTSPPTKPEILEFLQTLYRGPQTLFARWQRSEDRESGILRYLYSIGKRPLGTDVVDNTTVSPTFAYFYALPSSPLKNGDTLFLTVRAFNNSRLPTVEPMTLESMDTASLIIQFSDRTPPPSFNTRFTKNISYTGSVRILTSITFAWDSTYDRESGIYAYRFRFEAENGEPITNWTDATSGMRSIDFTPSQFRNMGIGTGRFYIFKVEAINGAGLTTASSVRFSY